MDCKIHTPTTTPITMAIHISTGIVAATVNTLITVKRNTDMQDIYPRLVDLIPDIIYPPIEPKAVDVIIVHNMDSP